MCPDNASVNLGSLDTGPSRPCPERFVHCVAGRCFSSTEYSHLKIDDLPGNILSKIERFANYFELMV